LGLLNLLGCYREASLALRVRYLTCQINTTFVTDMADTAAETLVPKFSRFLDLPLDIRCMIYTFAFDADTGIIELRAKNPTVDLINAS
jgi:hypothetical protein